MIHRILPLSLIVFLAGAVAGCAGNPPAERPSADRGLAQRVLVPGTGVTFHPPHYSALLPFGTVFIDSYRDLEITVNVLDDDRSTRDRFLSAALQEGEILSEQPVRLSDRDASLVRSQLRRGGSIFERWHLVSASGSHLMYMSATFPGNRRSELTTEVRTSLLSVEWNPDVPIDPEAAFGIRIHQLEGLQVDRSSSRGVVVRPAGRGPSSEPGEPLLIVRRAPAPLNGLAARCAESLSGLFAGQAEVLETVLNGGFSGCEVVGTTTSADGREVVTHLALLFRNQQALLVMGNVAAADRDPWIRRFRRAARSVSYSR